MGYVVLVNLKESVTELHVDELMAQIMCLDGVESVVPEWRSDRKRKGTNQNPNLYWGEKRRREGSALMSMNDSSEDFDRKLLSLFEEGTPTSCIKTDLDDSADLKDDQDQSHTDTDPDELDGEGEENRSEFPKPSALAKNRGRPPKPRKEGINRENKENMVEKETATSPSDKPDRVKCQLCQKYVQFLQLRWHAATHCSRKQYKCALCDFGGNIPQVMKNHLTKIHQVEDGKRDVDFLDKLDDELKEHWIEISARCFPDHADITKSHIMTNRRRERKGDRKTADTPPPVSPLP